MRMRSTTTSGEDAPSGYAVDMVLSSAYATDLTLLEFSRRAEHPQIDGISWAFASRKQNNGRHPKGSPYGYMDRIYDGRDNACVKIVTCHDVNLTINT